MTTAVQLAQSVAPGVSLGFKNRILNGNMTIDQRNAGASVTPTTDGTYTVDRWRVSITQASKFSVQQNAGSVTPPAGFSNYLGMTSTSAYSVGAGDVFGMLQAIEGLNVADLAWGTANASAVTLSFKVYSSLTGTFSGSLFNSAITRSYPFTYTVNSANTWTSVSVTVPGDTTGTWLTTNGIGLCVYFCLGTGSTYGGTAGAWTGSAKLGVASANSVVGTNGATFYITGVQLEVGTAATSFEFRDYGRELALCQRYYEKSYSQSIAPGTAGSTNGATRIFVNGSSGSVGGISSAFAVVKRADPTMTMYSPANGAAGYGYSYSTASNRLASAVSGTSSVFVYDADASVATSCNELFHWTASAEL